MFEATYISACVLGIIFTGAWLAVNARWDRDRAITCTKGIPNNAPIWYHIKDDHQKLYVIGSGHTPLIVGGNITLAFFASISFAVGSFVPIIFA